MKNTDKMKVIVTGNLCKDRSGYLDTFITEDDKRRIYDWAESPGGPVATAAVVVAAFSQGYSMEF